MKKKKLLLLPLIILPAITSAATRVFSDFVDGIIDIINVIVPLLISLAIVLFFFHTGKGIFGTAKDGGEAQTRLKETLFWGVVIIFVMVSIWGILSLLGGEFDLAKPSFVG